MRNHTGSEQIERFLEELDRALSEHTEAERTEIVGSVREHIESALGDSDRSGQEVDRVLRSLGDPLAIAAAAETDGSGTANRPSARTPHRRLASWWVPSIVLPLTAFSGFALFLMFPVVPLLIGLAFFWNSSLWKPLEKVVGTFAMTVPAALLVAGFLFTWGAGPRVCSSGTVVGDSSEVTETCTGGVPDWVQTLSFTGVITLYVVGIAIMVVLIARGSHRSGELHG